LLLFTFCVDIKRRKRQDMNRMVRILVNSLDIYVKDYSLIVYTNYDMELINPHVIYRPYYNKSSNCNNNIFWNLSFNKINIYKDLHDEFNEDFTWVDFDTIIMYDISYLNNLKNCFIEIGGCSKNPNILFTNNNSINVPRNMYIQGNFWKLDIELYHKLFECLDYLTLKKLALRNDLQDLYSYYAYIYNGGYSKDMIILGRNYLQDTLNGLSIWDISGITHAKRSGLVHLYYDNGKLRSKFYCSKECHILSFTSETLIELWDTMEFNQLFKNINN